MSTIESTRNPLLKSDKLISLMGTCRFLTNSFRTGIAGGLRAESLGLQLWATVKSWSPLHSEISYEFVESNFSLGQMNFGAPPKMLSRKSGKAIILKKGFHVLENGQVHLDVLNIGPIDLFVDSSENLQISLREAEHGLFVFEALSST